MKKQINKNMKKISALLKGIRNIIIILFVIIFFINLNLWNETNTKISIFNKIGLAVVVSDSMEPVLSVNDLIVINKKDNYQVGDIIVYRFNNELIVHRIVKINQEQIVTKGDANKYEDNAISLDKVYGKLGFSIPYVGGIVNFFKTGYGIFSVIALVVFMFIYSYMSEQKEMVND